MSDNQIRGVNDLHEYFIRAMEAPSGIAVECGTNDAAKRLRFRLNRWRLRQKKEGISIEEFSAVVVTVEGTEVHISSGKLLPIRTL